MTIKLSSHVLSFNKKLFLSVISLFIAFAICFMAFQYRREKEYKIELLNTQLQNYNDRLNDFLRGRDTLNIQQLNDYVCEHTFEDLRVTLINKNGTVIYDNLEKDPSHFENHHNRQEIKEAIIYGSGYSINRQSESLGGEFFYSAKYYPNLDYIIRSALPYNVSLMRHLKADSHYVWFTLIISLILIIVFYRFTHKLGMSITKLQQFAMKADRNEPIDTDMQDTFPKNELGEISQHIIQIYKRLHQAKEDLYIEREKLITHLQISHEGLGVFNHRKEEILVNNLFTQYANLISDKNLSSTEEIFSIPELQPITRFITKNKERSIGAMKADRNEPIDTDMQDTFPKNELGEISQHIIQIYKRLHQAKEDLYIEREKLITHLQISHEGLGVFNHRKEEILVNNLFTQYANLISDKNLSSTEEIFSIPELQPITRFITKNKERSIGKEEKRMSLNIDKNGRIFAVECIIFQDDSFEISINDITQEKEQALLKKQLTQNIAHELKTPVSSIQGYLETIVNNPTLPREKINAFLERSYAQSNRLAHLLRDISVLTRMEEAPNMIETEPVNLTTMMRNILNEVTLELEEKQITAHNMLPEGLTIQGNSSLLYSIFRNLTDNAIAYAGTHISITIRCFREDERFYYFSFSDTGVGVGPEHLSRLFERFYRVDKGRSRKLGGTGLGLAIVKNAVILHGGTIFAKNTPGGGLEFIFTLSKE